MEAAAERDTCSFDFVDEPMIPLQKPTPLVEPPGVEQNPAIILPRLLLASAAPNKQPAAAQVGNTRRWLSSTCLPHLLLSQQDVGLLRGAPGLNTANTQKNCWVTSTLSVVQEGHTVLKCAGCQASAFF